MILIPRLPIRAPHQATAVGNRTQQTQPLANDMAVNPVIEAVDGQTRAGVLARFSRPRQIGDGLVALQQSSEFFPLAYTTLNVDCDVQSLQIG